MKVKSLPYSHTRARTHTHTPAIYSYHATTGEWPSFDDKESTAKVLTHARIQAHTHTHTQTDTHAHYHERNQYHVHMLIQQTRWHHENTFYREHIVLCGIKGHEPLAALDNTFYREHVGTTNPSTCVCARTSLSL